MLEQLTGRHREQSDHEEALLLAYCGGSEGLESLSQMVSRENAAVWDDLFLKMLAESRQLSAVAVVLQSASGAALMDAARIYREVALAMGGKVEVAFYRKKPAPEQLIQARDLPDQVKPEPMEKPAAAPKILHGDGTGYGAVVLWITGPLAALVLQSEDGVHAAEAEPEEGAGKKKAGKPVARERWRFSLSVRPAGDYSKPEDLVIPAEELLRPDLATVAPRRVYDLSRGVVKDSLTHEKRPGHWTAAGLLEALRRGALQDAGWTEAVERGLQ